MRFCSSTEGFTLRITPDSRNSVEVVVSGTKRVRSYDLSDGTLLWECGGLSQNVVATPVANENMVYVAGVDQATLNGIRVDPNGKHSSPRPGSGTAE